LQDVVEDIEDEAQGELIEMIDGAEVLEDEECRATCLRQRQILGPCAVVCLVVRSLRKMRFRLMACHLRLASYKKYVSHFSSDFLVNHHENT